MRCTAAAVCAGAACLAGSTQNLAPARVVLQAPLGGSSSRIGTFQWGAAAAGAGTAGAAAAATPLCWMKGPRRSPPR